MKNIPFILSLAYRERIETLCKKLPDLGLKYFVCYIVFNNGQAFVLSNMFSMLVPYYADGYYKEDNSFKKNITSGVEYYLCNSVKSVSDRFQEALESRFNIFRAYYTVRNCPECQFIFGAIKDTKFDNHEKIYKSTINNFEDFCLNFVNKFIDEIKYYNPSYHNSIILNDAHYRKKVIKNNSIKPERLTAREIQSIHFAALGKSSEETGLILGIKKSTVNFYREEAIRKLNSSNITHAVFEAMKHGYIGDFDKIWKMPDAVSINGFSIREIVDQERKKLHNTNNLLLLNGYG